MFRNIVLLNIIVIWPIYLYLCFEWLLHLRTGTEWPFMSITTLIPFSNLPILGPRKNAPTKAAHPPSKWTTPLPAKSCENRGLDWFGLFYCNCYNFWTILISWSILHSDKVVAHAYQGLNRRLSNKHGGFGFVGVIFWVLSIILDLPNSRCCKFSLL